MITGSIRLNNLTDQQLTQVMEQKDRHEGTFLFNPGTVREVQAGTQVLNDEVDISWNSEEGMHAVLEICHTLLGETATVAKTA